MPTRIDVTVFYDQYYASTSQTSNENLNWIIITSKVLQGLNGKMDS